MLFPEVLDESNFCAYLRHVKTFGDNWPISWFCPRSRMKPPSPFSAAFLPFLSSGSIPYFQFLVHNDVKFTILGVRPDKGFRTITQLA